MVLNISNDFFQYFHRIFVEKLIFLYYMFASLSTAILYYWSLKNNITLPIIIPILLSIRSFTYLLPPNNILSRMVNLQQKTNKYLEYIFAFLISILLLLYLVFTNSNYKYDDYYKNIITNVMYFVIIIFIIQFAFNFAYLSRK